VALLDDTLPFQSCQGCKRMWSLIAETSGREMLDPALPSPSPSLVTVSRVFSLICRGEATDDTVSASRGAGHKSRITGRCLEPLWNLNGARRTPETAVLAFLPANV
jgi:hypothetical protein